MPKISKATEAKTTKLQIEVRGKISKSSTKLIEKNPWDLKNFLWSEMVAFRKKDAELMKTAFRSWWKQMIKDYGKSKWIECIIFCRRMKERKRTKQKK